MPTITNIKELYTDQIINRGGTRDINMRLLVRFDDGSEKWYYYGTDPAGAPAGTESRPPIHFPTDFFNLADDSMLFDVAVQVAQDLLNL